MASLVFVPPWVDDPYNFQTPFYHSSRDLRVRDEVALEEARRDGPRPGDARRRLSAATRTATPARRGRPSTGARERILEAALEVLKADGYAGLDAKVAAGAGENKALIGYHFGSKQGLVAAVGREVGESITAEVVAEIGDPDRWTRSWPASSRVCGGSSTATEVARVYFDLTAVSVVDPESAGRRAR